MGSKEGPALEFTDPLFRRRLSQISRMTIQVLHDILPIGEETKIVFVSFRGEITQQFKINRMLIEEGDLTPAAFSLSVFNTPPALASIALNLSAGYSAVYPAATPQGAAGVSAGDRRFVTGFLAAAAPVLCGSAAEIVLAYADELCPPEYDALCPPDNEPFAFAAVLSPDDGGIPLEIPQQNRPKPPLDSPRGFLKYLCRN
jgi:hypothetical protein